MLKQLNIQNYALLDQLEISFSNELTIITGETGAGKSILLGALSLIVGQRADSGALQDKNRKCIVEGIFAIKGYRLSDFFKQKEIDYSDETIIRREINPEGKSRAFINDTPVTLTLLKELGEQLIDIHSQHETLTLNNSAFQLALVDVYAANTAFIEAYSKDYKLFKQQQQLLNELTERETQSKKDIDYFQFLFNELDEINLKEGSQELFEQELQTLTNAEEIKINLSKAYNALNGGEKNLLSSLSEIKTLLSSLAKYNSSILILAERIDSTLIELKDISGEIDAAEQNTNYDSKRIEELNLQLDSIYRLQNKHHVKNISELISIRQDLFQKLNAISSLEEEIKKVKIKLSAFEKSIRQQADLLSKKRKAAIPEIEIEIIKTLSALGMPNAILKIEQSPLPDNAISPSGSDKINY
ncbi:MAG: AAA family ATPase, partial [Bacteroidia bacterium]|nr:AAA family ATPase [Bacteroidia bacterium]